MVVILSVLVVDLAAVSAAAPLEVKREVAFDGHGADERVVRLAVGRPHGDAVVASPRADADLRTQPDVDAAACLEAGADAVDAEVIAAEHVQAEPALEIG